MSDLLPESSPQKTEISRRAHVIKTTLIISLEIGGLIVAALAVSSSPKKLQQPAPQPLLNPPPAAAPAHPGKPQDKNQLNPRIEQGTLNRFICINVNGETFRANDPIPDSAAITNVQYSNGVRVAGKVTMNVDTLGSMEVKAIASIEESTEREIRKLLSRKTNTQLTIEIPYHVEVPAETETTNGIYATLEAEAVRKLKEMAIRALVPNPAVVTFTNVTPKKPSETTLASLREPHP